MCIQIIIRSRQFYLQNISWIHLPLSIPVVILLAQATKHLSCWLLPWLPNGSAQIYSTCSLQSIQNDLSKILNRSHSSSTFKLQYVPIAIWVKISNPEHGVQGLYWFGQPLQGHFPTVSFACFCAGHTDLLSIFLIFPVLPVLETSHIFFTLPGIPFASLSASLSPTFLLNFILSPIYLKDIYLRDTFPNFPVSVNSPPMVFLMTLYVFISLNKICDHIPFCLLFCLNICLPP